MHRDRHLNRVRLAKHFDTPRQKAQLGPSDSSVFADALRPEDSEEEGSAHRRSPAARNDTAIRPAASQTWNKIAAGSKHRVLLELVANLFHGERADLFVHELSDTLHAVTQGFINRVEENMADGDPGHGAEGHQRQRKNRRIPRRQPETD